MKNLVDVLIGKHYLDAEKTSVCAGAAVRRTNGAFFGLNESIRPVPLR